MKKCLTGLVLLIMMITFSVSSYAAASGEIVVNGTGVVTVAPDIAYVSLGVSLIAPTAQDAQTKNALVMSQIMADLINDGLNKKDLQTSNFSLYPEYKYNKDSEPGQIIGYRVTNQVTVTVREISKVGAVIDLAIKAGATNINSVIFSVSATEEWRNKVIEAAVTEARAKADIMAKAAKVTIKRVLAINESSINVQPVQMDAMFKSASLRNVAVSTPIEAGDVKITVDIQMKFEI
ncbi:MAG TPA: hypothetical protein DDW65_01545 [Firmicutes bacterium]|jgi:uncharacterized protein|nr:hypothetical protein [Bacillota bacterium]